MFKLLISFCIVPLRACVAILGSHVPTPRTPAGVFVFEATAGDGGGVRAGVPERWTFSEVGGLRTESFVEPTLIHFKSFDDLVVPAWYYRPKVRSTLPWGGEGDH